MNHYLYILFLVLISQLNYAQTKKVVVRDSKTAMQVSEVSVFNSATKKVSFTNNNGEIELVASNKDSIEFSKFGYQNLKLPYQSIKDTVTLKNESIILDEVLISNKNHKLTFEQSKSNTQLGFNYLGEYFIKIGKNLGEFDKITIPVKIRKNTSYAEKIIAQFFYKNIENLSFTAIGNPIELTYSESEYSKLSQLELNIAEPIDTDDKDIYLGIRLLPNEEYLNSGKSYSMNPFILFHTKVKYQENESNIYFRFFGVNQLKQANELFGDNPKLRFKLYLSDN